MYRNNDFHSPTKLGVRPKVHNRITELDVSDDDADGVNYWASHLAGCDHRLRLGVGVQRE